MGLKVGRVELLVTPLRYELGDVMAAQNEYNRRMTGITGSIFNLTPREICKGPMERLEPNSITIFYYHGVKWADKSLRDEPLVKVMGQHIRTVEAGGSGGTLADFIPDIVKGLVDAGIIELESDAEPSKEASHSRPQMRLASSPE